MLTTAIMWGDGATELEKMYVGLRNEYNELDVQASGYRSRISELEAENAQLKSEIVSLKEQQTLDIRAEFGIIEARLSELERLIRYNPYHDSKGRFTTKPAAAIDISAGSGIIKSEVEKGNISLTINHEKQARHIKGSEQYVEGRSYLTITESEAQTIVNTKAGTGKIIKNIHGVPEKEKIDCGKTIGCDVDFQTKVETKTDKGTIHYSKTGTHLVPRKESNNGNT